MCKKFFLLISFMLMTVPTVSSVPLKVDLSQRGDVEPGWIDWNTGGVNLNNSDATRQFLNEATFDDDFTIVFIKIDSRNRGQVSENIPLHDLLDDCFKDSNPFDMVLKRLAAGVYIITTYHHDENEDVVNDDGTINITVTDADGTRVVVDHLQQSWGPNPTFVGTATFGFRCDGVSDVVITFADNNDGIHNEAHLNGFVIDVPVIPENARNPNPTHEETDVPRDVTLSWMPGVYADKHDVYLGTNFNDVTDADRATPLGVLVSQNHEPNSYSPAEVLQWEQTYCWRIDEVNAPPDYTIYKGNVWSFTIELFAHAIENVISTASSSEEGKGPENTINGNGLDSNDLHSRESAAMWISSMTGAQPTWIQYEFDRVYKLHEMWVWNYNVEFEHILGFGFKNVTIEYSSDGANWATLGATHEFARAPGTPGYAHNTTVDFGAVPAKYVRLTANNNWGGVVPQYGLSEVRFFHIPVFAREPNPASGVTDTDVEAVLSWRAGREAASHNVYFSSDERAVIDETISPVSIPADSSYTSYNTGELVLDQSYYWKVNEVNEAGTPTTWQGDVWNFSTQKYLVVDDFEDYNDFEPDRIFDIWIDGYNVAANGSQIGSDMPPFAEQTIVHGGKQSMPLHYNNTGGATYSEAERTFAVTQDWTKHGIKTLVLYFHGTGGNTGQLYVKLNNSKVVYDGDAADIATPQWKQWNIDLASVGVNLQNVTKLSIGVDGNGASGTLYLDDIRLYRLAPGLPGL